MLPFGVVMTGEGMTGGWSGSVLGLGANDMGTFPCGNSSPLLIMSALCLCMLHCDKFKEYNNKRERIQNGLFQSTRAYRDLGTAMG